VSDTYKIVMKNIWVNFKKKWRNYVTTFCIFLSIFLLLYWFSILDFSSKTPVQSFTGESFSGKLGADFQSKIGATDVYQLAYPEWATQYGLSAANNGYDNDPDGEGLPNYLEFVHGTDPTQADTDGDGFNDRQEILNGYDPDAPGEAKPAMLLTIKKIGVTAPLIWSLSNDEDSMQKDLENGVIHLLKTAAPGQTGNMVISGHSSNYIWAAGNFKFIFKDLNNLAVGDTVDVKTVQKNGRAIVYHYRITEKNVVSSDDPSIFSESTDSTLTLSTCWPLGTNFKRLIIKAELIK
jgi:LPXTG-site transpeptidase (sortase) family protein